MCIISSFMKLYFVDIYKYIEYIFISISNCHKRLSVDLNLLTPLWPVTMLSILLRQDLSLWMLWLCTCVPNMFSRLLTRLTSLSRGFLSFFLSLTDISCFTDFIVFVIKTDRNNSSSSSRQFSFLRLKERTVKALISPNLLPLPPLALTFLFAVVSFVFFFFLFFMVTARGAKRI